jgi:anti-sigma-K factor RskA
MNTLSRDDLLALLPAYALGALDPDERAAVEAWLPTDAEARALLAHYQAVTDQLYVLAPARPAPAHLEADLRRRLAAERAPAARRRTDATPFWRRGRTWLAAAALLIVLVGAAVLLQGLSGNGTPTPDAGALYATLAAQADARRFAIEVAEEQANLRGELIVTASGDRAVLRVEQLPQLPADQTFQLWLLDVEGTLRSGGIFRAEDEVTHILIPLERPLTAYQRFGVSIEPAGGSPYPDRPTGPVVFRVYVNS